MTNITRIDYCQFLLVSQTNYTLTYFADHRPGFSHDALKRYLEQEKLTARMVWEQVKGHIVSSPQGYVAFDDTVLDHNSAAKIELVRRQYSGNAHGVIKGIGVVTCVYIHPDLDTFWVIDYRIYDPERDGKTKLDHVREMLDNAVTDKALPFRGVLMDSWYAERKLMLHIEQLGKVYYCPLKANRQVDVTPQAPSGYQRVDSLSWTDDQHQHGRRVHLKDFPKGHTVNLFRLALSTQRTDYIVTNDSAQDTTRGAQEVCALRWKIEQFHREAKQTTGMEGCQCRLARIQRNHIACAMLVWVRLRQVAQQAGATVYSLKQGLLDDYMRSQLRSPTIPMTFA
jgi:hypothetical protein